MPTGAYTHTVYYCSQDVAAAVCQRSDDGGQIYGPSSAIYNANDCLARIIHRGLAA